MANRRCGACMMRDKQTAAECAPTRQAALLYSVSAGYLDDAVRGQVTERLSVVSFVSIEKPGNRRRSLEKFTDVYINESFSLCNFI